MRLESLRGCGGERHDVVEFVVADPPHRFLPPALASSLLRWWGSWRGAPTWCSRIRKSSGRLCPRPRLSAMPRYRSKELRIRRRDERPTVSLGPGKPVSRTPCSCSASRPSKGPSQVRNARLAADAVAMDDAFRCSRCKSWRHLPVPRADFAWDNRVQAIRSAAKAGIPVRLGHAPGYASALSRSVTDP
jgi:hypothetical protein